MGLDMYLYGVMYLSDFKESEKRIAEQIKPIFFLEGLDLSTPRYVKWELGYWRKANAIHSWFVQNVQEGNDDCGNYWVSLENLESLRMRCLAVLKHKKKLSGYKLTKEDRVQLKNYTDPGDNGLFRLDPTGGFFFGSTDIDEGYYDDLRRTVAIIDKCLPLADKGLDFEYHSSW